MNGNSPDSESRRGSMNLLTSESVRGQQGRPQPKEYCHGHVPKNLNFKDSFDAQQLGEDGARPPTTLMIRNIPNRYSQRELITELEELGLANSFDFLYVPLDKGTMLNVGYAFVNFMTPTWAQQCMRVFRNYRFKRHHRHSTKIATVSVAHLQGLEANLAHYGKAAVSSAKMKQQRPVLVANISSALSSICDDADLVNTAKADGGPVSKAQSVSPSMSLPFVAGAATPPSKYGT